LAGAGTCPAAGHLLASRCRYLDRAQFPVIPASGRPRSRTHHSLLLNQGSLTSTTSTRSRASGTVLSEVPAKRQSRVPRDPRHRRLAPPSTGWRRWQRCPSRAPWAGQPRGGRAPGRRNAARGTGFTQVCRARTSQRAGGGGPLHRPPGRLPTGRASVRLRTGEPRGLSLGPGTVGAADQGDGYPGDHV
jgi:hypothetical protein